MKNVCCDKVEQKSSCGDIEVGGLWEPWKLEKESLYLGLPNLLRRSETVQSKGRIFVLFFNINFTIRSIFDQFWPLVELISRI